MLESNAKPRYTLAGHSALECARVLRKLSRVKLRSQSIASAIITVLASSIAKVDPLGAIASI
ncbi:MAG: hypothetical protein IGR76_07970 [Synechococcales cyanobacterium T60_A2020_003]|nr:hypothetical protein [Synechococcales cyanobacterium T60_A2020_003]